MIGLANALFPLAPPFTEKNFASQSEKVFIITGAALGVGYELAKLLYAKAGTVYIAARSMKRAMDTIERLKAQVPKTSGKMMPMVLDLADLPTIEPAVETFLRQEKRLDVLVHNAGVIIPAPRSKTKQVGIVLSLTRISS
jgi:NADP-dependent 3-hydroxy acid dehydrogenase YdfG